MPTPDANADNIPDFQQTPRIGVNGSDPAVDFKPVTPDDDEVQLFRSLYLTVDGSLRVTMFNGTVRNFTTGTFPIKTFLPLAVRRVHATGTTATVLGAV